MSNERPRIALFASRWLGAEVLIRLAAKPLDLALVAPSAEDRTARTAEALGLPWAAKADPVALMVTDLPWRPDLVVCAHSFRILPGWLLRWSRRGAIGYHPSLLPAFKGRHAVRDALAAGLAETGGTVYHLTDQIDGGPPVMGRSTPLQRPVAIHPEDTPATLWRRALAPLGADLLLEAVEAMTQP